MVAITSGTSSRVWRVGLLTTTPMRVNGTENSPEWEVIN
jgi:hypothetical protein